MPTRPDPLEDIQFRLSSIRRDALRLAMRDDTLDADERAHLEAMDATQAEVIDLAARRRVARYIEGGGKPTAYLNRLAAPLGMRIIALDEVRDERQLLLSPTGPESAG